MSATLIAFIAVIVASNLVAVVDLFGELVDEMTESRRNRPVTAVDSAHAITEHYYNEFRQGRLPEDQAKARAIEALKGLRYNGSEYVWINDMYPRMVMHPIRPDLDGKDLTDHKDPAGKRLFIAFVDTVRSQGAGFVEYLWPRPGGKEPVEKVSYVRQFAPWGWVIGSGVYVDDIKGVVDAQIAEHAIMLLVTGAIVVLLCVWTVRGTNQPILNMVAVMRAVVDGKDDVDVSERYTRRQDVIGDMARAIAVFRDSLRERRRLSEAMSEKDRLLQSEKRRNALDITERLERTSSDIAGVVQEEAEGASKMAEEMARVSSEVTGACTAASSAAEQAAANVQSVAAAAEQLASSVTEVSRQAAQAADIASHAQRQADGVNQTIRALSAAAESIGEIVTMIGEIASQTNLLALNATIEAARAGDSGKGFAVVANEVKSLAKQTAAATGRISQQIADIQDATQRSAAEIDAVVAVIDDITRIGAHIAAAVEQQGASTQEIARNVAEAAVGTHQASAEMGKVAAAADHTRHLSDAVLDASGKVVVKMYELREAMTETLRSSDLGNRRRFERFPLRQSVDIALNGRTARAEVLDLSEGGARLALDQAVDIAPGQPLAITIGGTALPAAPVWTGNSELGVIFQDMTGEQKARLEKLLEAAKGRRAA